MLFHNTEGPPCAHMENLLQQVADGTLSGWRKWYAVAHAAQCLRCGNFLKRLSVSLEILRSSKKEDENAAAIERLRTKIRSMEVK